MIQAPWRKITVRRANLEDLAFEVIENGAASSVITDDSIECYVSAESADDFLRWCHDARIEIVQDEAIVEKNWHAACAELWGSIEIEGLTIVPVANRSSASNLAADHLAIIPGQGFGTGHHDTTRMLLEDLVRIRQGEGSLKPKRIADIGSGSGILALAAAKIFGVPVDGVEIEKPAVENATENIEINGLRHLVEVRLGESKLLRQSYDLVLANIYGEVLMALLPEMERLVAPNGLLCVSGISELTALQVASTYTHSESFVIEKRASANEWEMIRFRRVGKVVAD